METFESAKVLAPHQQKPYVEFGPREFRRFVLALGLLTGLLALCIFGSTCYCELSDCLRIRALSQPMEWDWVAGPCLVSIAMWTYVASGSGKFCGSHW